MGEFHTPPPVLRLLAAFSSHHEALDQAREWAIRTWGPLLAESPRFDFRETDYYLATMGPQLKKTFFAFRQLMSPGELAAAKRASNVAEAELARHLPLLPSRHPRPLNLDPGYLNESKLVLASTKDHAHRIYLQDHVFAEITLRFQKGTWQPWPWTYPDYRRADYHQFFDHCRTLFRQLKPPPTP